MSPQGHYDGLDDLDTDGSLRDKNYQEKSKTEGKELANANVKYSETW